jgi:hypothetical protein
MNYKTIVLHLMEDRPRLYDRLRRERALLFTLDLYSAELKTGHEAWKERLLLARPGSATGQVESEALELALQELRDRLPEETQADESLMPSPGETDPSLNHRSSPL